MIIELNKNPVKFILIKEFLGEESYSYLMKYASNLDNFERGSVGDTFSPVFDINIKKNLNIWLTYPNPIGIEMQKVFWSQEIIDATRAMDDLLFRAHNLTNGGNFLVSRYDEEDYYNWHTDDVHYLTMNYVIQTADEGGVFQISDKTHDIGMYEGDLMTVTDIPNISNSMIIFPGMYFHRVTPIKKGQRLTLQHFTSREIDK